MRESRHLGIGSVRALGGFLRRSRSRRTRRLSAVERRLGTCLSLQLPDDLSRDKRYTEARVGVRFACCLPEPWIDAQSVQVYKTPDDRVTKAVAFVLMKADYKPGKCAGNPCAMDYLFEFNFAVR